MAMPQLDDVLKAAYGGSRYSVERAKRWLALAAARVSGSADSTFSPLALTTGSRRFDSVARGLMYGVSVPASML